MSVIALADVKDALDKSLDVDNDELQRMIDAAEAEYADYVGALPGDVDETFDGGSTALVLAQRNVTALTAASYADGTPISLTDLELNGPSGIVYWGYGTAGRFAPGYRNVQLSYTVGALPANHREAIIADVAGYFAATQRGPQGLPGEGYEAAFTASPLVLFPRIRALAPPRIA